MTPTNHSPAAHVIPGGTPVRLFVLGMVLGLLAACASSTSRGTGYEPVPDDVLFARAAQVDGVTDIALRYTSTAGNRGYDGRVVLDGDLSRSDAGRSVATIYAILRQGRFNVPITLDVTQDGRDLSGPDLPGVPAAGAPDLLLETFGPQPGDGTPPPG